MKIASSWLLTSLIGIPNLLTLAVSTTLLILYPAVAPLPDPATLPAATARYCPASLLVVVKLDAALSAALFLLAVVLAGGSYFATRMAEAGMWATAGLMTVKLAVAAAGLRVVFGEAACKAGDLPVWAGAAVHLVGFFGTAIAAANLLVCEMTSDDDEIVELKEHALIGAHAAFNIAVLAAIAATLARYDTPYETLDATAALPKPATIDVPAAAETFLLCEQAVPSYLYFEAAVAFSVVSACGMKMLLEGVAWVCEDEEVSTSWPLRMETGFWGSWVFKIITLIYGSKQVWTASICPQGDPMLFRFSTWLLLARYFELITITTFFAVYKLHFEASRLPRRRRRHGNQFRPEFGDWGANGLGNDYDDDDDPNRPRFIVATREPANGLGDRELIHLCTRVYLYEPPAGKGAGEDGGGGGDVERARSEGAGTLRAEEDEMVELAVRSGGGRGAGRGAGLERAGGEKESGKGATADVVEVIVVEKEEREERRQKVQVDGGVGEGQEAPPGEDVESGCRDHGCEAVKGCGVDGAAEDGDDVVSNPTTLERSANAAYAAVPPGVIGSPRTGPSLHLYNTDDGGDGNPINPSDTANPADTAVDHAHDHANPEPPNVFLPRAAAATSETASLAPSLASTTHRFVGPLAYATPPYAEPDCPICFAAFRRGDRVREMLHCGHAFHKRCVEAWVVRGGVGSRGVRCPVCRAAGVV